MDAPTSRVAGMHVMQMGRRFHVHGLLFTGLHGLFDHPPPAMHPPSQQRRLWSTRRFTHTPRIHSRCADVLSETCACRREGTLTALTMSCCVMSGGFGERATSAASPSASFISRFCFTGADAGPASAALAWALMPDARIPARRSLTFLALHCH